MNRRLARLLPPALLLVLACAPAPAAKPATGTAGAGPAAPAGSDAARGSALFAQKGCAVCHGANAQGLAGPKIAGTQLAFERVLAQIRNGSTGMPPFIPEVLADSEVADIYAHLRSLAP